MLRRVVTSLVLSAVLLATALVPVSAQSAQPVRTLPCTHFPAPRFAQAYNTQSEVFDLLGCPLLNEFEISVISQRFERGWMLREWTTSPPTLPLIEAMFEDDRHYARFDDQGAGKDATPSQDAPPPPGWLAASGNFGRVWRDAPGAPVRQRLGSATGPARVGRGTAEWFQRGALVWSQDLHQIFLLAIVTADMPPRILRSWRVYGDGTHAAAVSKPGLSPTATPTPKPSPTPTPTKPKPPLPKLAQQPDPSGPAAAAISIAALEFATYLPPGADAFDMHTAPIGAELPDAALSMAAYLSQALGVDGVGRLLDASVAGFQRDGSVLAWGDDPGLAVDSATTAWARAGDGTPNVPTPQRSSQFSVELSADGTVWTSGANNLGQLGDGTTLDQTTRLRLGGLSDIVTIASGDAHTLALGRDGSVWAWGSNEHGQLGATTADLCDNGSPCSRVPVQVMGIDRAVGIAASRGYSLALVSNDSAY